MQNKHNNKNVLINFIWRFLERCGAQGVTFIVSIVLARLLDPDVYGVIALVTVFTTILQVFVDSGFGNALIQKKDVDDLDYSSVFYFNISVCVILYLIMFFCAPFIANFYEMPELKAIVRVVSLILIISGVKNIQQAYVSRNLMFKKFFFATLGGTVGAAVIGIFMAYKGFGVWALVAQMLFNAIIDTLVLWFTVKWRPKLMFSWQRLGVLFSFGWKMLASHLLESVYTELRSLIIGKKYSKSDLAFFNKAKVFPNLAVTSINTSIDSVLFPSMSVVQDDKTRIRDMTRRSIKTSSFFMWPIMIGIAVCAEPLVRLILTEKWLPCVPYFRIFCIYYVFYPIQTANLNAIKAMGRGDKYLIISIAKKTAGLIILLSTIWFGVKVMAYGLIIESFVTQIINSWPNRKMLGYGYGSQIKDILPPALTALVMGVAVFAVSLLKLNDILTLIIQIPLGVIVYLGLSFVSKSESLTYIISLVKSFLHSKNGIFEKTE